MDRKGVWGAFELKLPLENLVTWQQALVIRTHHWPAPLQTNTAYLPDYGGVLPDEILVKASDWRASLRARGYRDDEIAEHHEEGDAIRVITHGELPHPCTIHRALARIAEDERVRFAHKITLDGSISLQAYFANYTTFCYWFDTFAIVLLRASELGGTGEGVFFYDDKCEEPVVFALKVDQKVRVTAIDPQNSRSLWEKWSAKFV